MDNLKRFINRNQKTIIYIVIAIVFIIIIFNGVNYYYTKKEEKNQKDILDNNITIENNYYNENNVKFNDIKTESVKNLNNDTIENTMKKFVSYCNSGDYNSAYNMITDECKTALKYNNAKIFKETYMDIRFEEPQEYKLTKWASDNNKVVCLVSFNGDILASGGAEFTVNDEYYTFVNKDYKYKINLNNYIYGEEKNEKYIFDNINVKIKNINYYSRYQEITMEITNKTDKSIAIAGNDSGTNVYLTNNNGTKYYAINSEFNEGKDVEIIKDETKEITVRFNKTYSSSNTVNKLVFSKVILDYQEYMNTHNRTSYSNIKMIEIDCN